MVLPNAIKPRGKELSEGAVAKLENDIKAALGDEPNVVRSEAA